MYNVFAGFNDAETEHRSSADSTPRLDKKAQQKPRPTGKTEAVSDKLGTEFDFTAKYKIYDNLTYMVGAGYLWAGDAFKGNNNANRVSNDYLLMNRISLNF